MLNAVCTTKIDENQRKRKHNVQFEERALETKTKRTNYLMLLPCAPLSIRPSFLTVPIHTVSKKSWSPSLNFLSVAGSSTSVSFPVCEERVLRRALFVLLLLLERWWVCVTVVVGALGTGEGVEAGEESRANGDEGGEGLSLQKQ